MIFKLSATIACFIVWFSFTFNLNWAYFIAAGRTAYLLIWALQYANLFLINIGYVIMSGSALKVRQIFAGANFVFFFGYLDMVNWKFFYQIWRRRERRHCIAIYRYHWLNEIFVLALYCFIAHCKYWVQ